MSVPRHRMSQGGGPEPQFQLRDFQGMNNNPAREAISDDEFYWCENLIPLAAGNLSPVAVPTALGIGALTGEVNNPNYTMSFTITSAGVATGYVFAAFNGSGNAWVVNRTTLVATKIIAGLLSAGPTYATQYSNQGILIIDSNGYWDYNVTTAGVLTAWNNSLTGYVKQYSTTVAGGTLLHDTWTGGGTGAVIQTQYQVTSVVVNAAGAGYQVGDSLTLTDNNPTTAAQIIVTAVGGGGAITGITLPTGGVYPGTSPGGGAVAVGPTGNVVTGGSGAGATFTVKIQGVSVKITQPGSGYVGGGLLTDLTGALVTITTFTLSDSGVIGGTCIATYAGRVWIASQRTIFVTDINSYNSFGGAGLTFSINDSYLHNAITCLFAANNYLYIFGDNSIDALSNVTVSPTTGLTSFSRINVTTSIGTSAPASVFGYYRALVFFHASGIYLLSGATPEKVSEKISGIIRNIVPSAATNANGAAVMVQGELCLAMQFFIVDVFTQGGVNRPIIAMFFRGRWWVYSFSVNVPVRPAMVSDSVNGVMTMFAWAGANGAAPTLYQGFAGTNSAWLLMSKLWDGGQMLREKQSLSSAIAAVLGGGAASGVSFTVDTELGSSASGTYPVVGTLSGYQLLVDRSNQAQGPAQYLGLTVSGDGTDVLNVHALALRGKTERDMMQ